MGKMILVLMLISLIASPVMAIGPTKAAILYNIDSHDDAEAIGSAVKEDIFDIEGLDYDVLVASDSGETFENDEKVIVNGISYNYDVKENLGVFLGAGVGTERVNNLKAEHDKFVYGGVSYQF